MQASSMAAFLYALMHAVPTAASLSASILAVSSYLDCLSASLLATPAFPNHSVLSLILVIALDLTSSSFK